MRYASTTDLLATSCSYGSATIFASHSNARVKSADSPCSKSTDRRIPMHRYEPMQLNKPLPDWRSSSSGGILNVPRILQICQEASMTLKSFSNSEGILFKAHLCTPKTSTLKSPSKFRLMASAQSHTHSHCLPTAGFGGALNRSIN